MPRSVPSCSRRGLARLVGLSGIAALAGCSAPEVPRGPRPSLTGSPTAPTPSATQSVDARFDLFVPGRAEAVVNELRGAVTGWPIVRLSLTRTSARLTYAAADATPHTLRWQAGLITPGDDGTDLVSATSFDPHDFALGDIAGLFAQAAQVSGSASHQVLQINDFSDGHVLMTITTYPESSTVFFNPDGSLVPILDLSTAEGITAGLADVAKDLGVVRTLGITGGDQIWVEVAVGRGIIERRIRASRVPVYRASRKDENSYIPFEPGLVDPEVLARLVRTGGGLTGGDTQQPADLVIFRPPELSEPLVVLSRGTASLTLDLDGKPLTGR